MGRKKKSELSEDDKIEKFLTYIRTGNYVETACRASGLSKATFYRWMEKAREGDERYTDLASEVDEAMAQAEAYMVGCVYAASGQDAKIALEWLGRVYPDRWGKKSQIDIDHKIDNLMSTVVDKLRAMLPPSQFRTIMKELNKLDGGEEIEAEVIPALVESTDSEDPDPEDD